MNEENFFESSKDVSDEVRLESDKTTGEMYSKESHPVIQSKNYQNQGYFVIQRRDIDDLKEAAKELPAKDPILYLLATLIAPGATGLYISTIMTNGGILFDTSTWVTIIGTIGALMVAIVFWLIAFFLRNESNTKSLNIKKIIEKVIKQVTDEGIE